MSFVNSSRIIIAGENTFNHVHGHQVNGTINAGIVNLLAGQAVTKRTKYDQFREVIRGDMITVKKLGSRDLSKWDWNYRNGRMCGRLKAMKSFCTVEVYPDRQSKFTAMVYEGEDAQTLWEEDFQQFSCTDNPQLFGINQSAIPVLIFHHELVPCAQFYTGSFWMNIYLKYLARNRKCSDHTLWMNTASGVLFSGPEGPFTSLSYSSPVELIIVPSTVDMLKDDTSFSFFSKFGLSVDNSVLICASNYLKRICFDDLFVAEHHRSKAADPRLYLLRLWQNKTDHLPMDITGGLQLGTVYSPSLEAVARRPQGARSLWEWWRTDGFVARTELDGGLTRFKLDWVQREHVVLDVRYAWWTFRMEWLSQSLHVFDALDVTEGMEDFFIVDLPELFLQSATSPTLHNAERPSTPIYLFLHPIPTKILELGSWKEGTPYFWSFDETGQSRMSEQECERWGLPVLKILMAPQLNSWPTHVYTALRDWQKARGFDPTTSDWARSMSYPEFEIVDTKDCFVVVEETPDEEWEFLDA